MKEHIKVIISGGGTGGHIYPAVAIAQEIQLQYPNADILFVGAKDKMEMEKVPKAGYKIEGLWISGLQRKVTISNLLFPIKLISSIITSHKIINTFKPDIAIGVGGFASGPLLYAAAQRKIPTMIHEQNSYAGITNKWLSKKANKICVAYDGMEKFFEQNKIVKTGNPIRTDILDLSNKKEKGYQHFNFDKDKKTILIIGGSLGARTINNSIKKDIHKIDQNQIQVLWQTGKNYFEELKSLNSEAIKVTDFIYEMDLAYSIADVVISRAGASSISEIAVAKKPAILVPSPNVSEDHQTKNALALVNKQAAILVKDSDSEEQLVDRVLELINNESLQNNLIKNLEPFAIRDSRKRILEVVKDLIKTS
jgi:UDP-N-acetylglucosamine--N-acetylmuramyl-(pentapeptide) pyrophosphoryl-undecaprenol N-acetylglucosamine transferase